MADRLDRLERAVALLLLERYGGNNSVNAGELRRTVKGEMRELIAETVEREEARLVDATPLVQYTGRNLDALREFVGDAASVNADDTSNACFIVQNGTPTRVRAGAWLAQDPHTGKFYVTQSPKENP